MRTRLDGRGRAALLAVLACGLLIRLPFLAVDLRTNVDLEVMRGWARVGHERGLERVYEETRANYPPLSMAMLVAAAAVDARVSGAVAGDATLTALVKLPPLVADLVTGLAIGLAFRHRARFAAAIVCGLYVLNPAVWYVSAAWGQIDSVFVALMVLSVLALRGDRFPAACGAWALAVGSKVLALALAPVLVAVTWGARRPARVLQGVAAALAAAALVTAPWIVSGRLHEVLRASSTLPTATPMVDVSGYNLWYLLHLGDVHMLSSDLHPLAGPLSYRELSVGLLAGLTVAVVIQLRRALGRAPGAPVALAAAAMTLALFVVATDIHERHLMPVLPFLLLARTEHARAWVAYAVISVTLLFNLVTIAPFTPLAGNLVAIEPASPWIALLKVASVAVAAINVAILAWLLRALPRARTLAAA